MGEIPEDHIKKAIQVDPWDIPSDVMDIAVELTTRYMHDWLIDDADHETAANFVAARAILADRATRAARTEGVGEPLTWVDANIDGGPEAYEASTDLGFYQVFSDEDSAAGSIGVEWAADRGDFGLVTARRLGSMPDFDMAKALAQADHEKRTPAPSATPTTDEARRQAAEIAELRARQAERDRLFDLFERDPGQFAEVVAQDRAALRARAEEAGRAPVEGQ